MSSRSGRTAWVRAELGAERHELEGTRARCAASLATPGLAPDDGLMSPQRPRSHLRAIARDPLTHFLVIGGAFFVAHALLSANQGRSSGVAPAALAAAEAEFLQRQGRAPDEDERGALPQSLRREQALVDEARALGIDRSDPIVRRRLAQRMRFLLEDSIVVPEPTRADLQALLDADPSAYRSSSRRGFVHVFVHGHDPAAQARAGALGQRLRDGEEPFGLGDPFAHGTVFTSLAAPRVERSFGAEFSAELSTVPAQQWTQVRSTYGLHWVRVEAPDPASEVRVEDVEARLRADYRARALARELDRSIDAVVDRRTNQPEEAE
jgi:hypothetical protein